jgi:hypothetical protein
MRAGDDARLSVEALSRKPSLASPLNRKNQRSLGTEQVAGIPVGKQGSHNFPEGYCTLGNILDHEPSVVVQLLKTEDKDRQVGIRRMQTVVNDQIDGFG